jgi:hypothetical protein
MRAVCWPGVGDDVEVADGLCFNCPLQEPEDQQVALALCAVRRLNRKMNSSR